MKTFKESLFLKKSKKIKLVQFWSAWCGSCFDVDHLIKLQKENSNLEIYRLNVEENQAYAMKYSIVIVPTYIFFKDLKPSIILVGLQSKESLFSSLKNVK